MIDLHLGDPYDSELRVTFAGSFPASQIRSVQHGQFRMSNRISGAHGVSRYMLTEIGPGLFPEERHLISLAVDQRCRVSITHQGALRVLPKNDKGDSAHTTIQATVANYASMELLSKPLIMFEGSSLVNQGLFKVSGTGRLTYSEVVGKRIGTGSSLVSTNSFMADEKLIYNDLVALCSSSTDDAEIAWHQFLGGGNCVGNLYFLSATMAEHDGLKAGFAAHISSIDPVRRSTEIFMSQPHPTLSIIRMKSDVAEEIIEAFNHLTRTINEITGERIDG